MEGFTPISGLIGGSLIGLAAVLFMAVNGRTAGISGIVYGALSPSAADFSWRLAFVGGLVVSPLLYNFVGGDKPQIIYPHGVWLMVAGGFLVGVGTRIGNGCTSGHGVCGIARLSVRSVFATLTFLATGIGTVFVLHRVFGH